MPYKNEAALRDQIANNLTDLEVVSSQRSLPFPTMNAASRPAVLNAARLIDCRNIVGWLWNRIW